MNIVIVGGGTAGWITALLAAKRHPYHNIIVIESSKIGIIGVGESTTGRITDVLTNHIYDLGCDLNEFIIETGATLKYGIKHKGWTNNINSAYLAPIDGAWTHQSVPDPLFCRGVGLANDSLLTTSRCGYWLEHGLSNFDKRTNSLQVPSNAFHVDAHLVGKYFKKLCLRAGNVQYIDDEIVNVELDSVTGNIKTLNLQANDSVSGDFFIDCSGFHKVLMNELPNKWISYQANLPLNSAIPFMLDYDADELPVPYTTAWAQKNGWMWTVPLIDRKGNGYAFCDAFTTADKAQEEIETLLGKKINPARVIKFDSGRQENAWVKNCVAIGLSSAFLEPLEATSIHSSIVQAQMIVFEYLKPTLEETLNNGARNIHNQRVRKMYDDVKDFLVMHYMGGRDDSEFWKYITSGVVKTEFVSNLLEMVKTKVPTINDFPNYSGSAGWPLYSFVMAGLNLINPAVAKAELNFKLPIHGDIRTVTARSYYELQDMWGAEFKNCYTYNDFIKYIRDIRHKDGISNKQY